MIIDLLIGLPHDRPGGLILTLAYFIVTGLGATLAGLLYATVGILWPRPGLILQCLSALLRGIPPLLLVFMMAHVPHLTMGMAGLLALLLYSFSHTGEILRGFLLSYPPHLSEQARLMGLGSVRDWVELRFPWALRAALPALLSHWVSLLKDTGALIIVGIGELTTITKSLSESAQGFEDWTLILLLSAGLYLLTTLALIRIVDLASRRLTKPHVCPGMAPT